MHTFSEQDEVKGEIFNFDNVGDTIQGTLVGKELITQTKYNKPCWLYRLKTDDGNLKGVWGRPLIDPTMQQLQLGQIVELRFVASQPSRKGNDLKVIKVFADVKVIDEEWLKGVEESAMNEEMSETPSATPSATAAPVQAGIDVNAVPLGGDTSVPNTPTSVPNTPTSIPNTPTSVPNTPTSVPNTPTSVPVTPTAATLAPADTTEKLSLIGDLAKIKLGITDPNTVADGVMQATGLAWLQNNYDEIIKKLEVMPDK